MLAEWMLYHDQENPFYESFDRLLEILGKDDVTLSLGDGLRPGSLADATDRAQLAELLELGRLVKRSRAAGIQVMVEGPGHVPLNQVADNVALEKKVCHGAPFYVLGPLVTDIAPGYDHITGAIGGAVASMAGADFLCYVTPAEHLRLPDVDDVKTGVIASKLAAHAGDIAKGIDGARLKDDKLSRARSKLDWATQAKLALDPELVRKRRRQLPAKDKDVCSMCGEYCAMKTFNRVAKPKRKRAKAVRNG
jgi:phosphomethylpyrimidine synthase